MSEKKDIKQILRLSTISSNKKVSYEVYELPKTPKTDYIVDDSDFIPISEAIKNIHDNSIGADEINIYYDLPNGKDDGRKIPVNRRHDIKDVTEISEAILEEVKENVEKQSKIISELNAQQKIANMEKNFNNSSSSDVSK